MEKILFYALLLLPGYIVIKTAEHFGLHSNKMSALEEILRYMIAGGISVLLTVWVAFWLNFIPWGISWKTFSDWCGSPMFVLHYISLSVLMSVLIGSLWTYVTKFIMEKANWLNKKLSLNFSFSEPLPFKLFADNKDHFIIIRKNDLDIGVGFLNAIQHNRQDHLEIDIVDYPEYREELKRARKGEESYLSNIRHIYMDLESGLTIYETDFPPEWNQKKN